MTCEHTRVLNEAYQSTNFIIVPLRHEITK